MIIRIDDGDTFEGSPKQFANCFFSNITIGNIKQWGIDNGMEVEFIFEKWEEINCEDDLIAY